MYLTIQLFNVQRVDSAEKKMGVIPCRCTLSLNIILWNFVFINTCTRCNPNVLANVYPGDCVVLENIHTSPDILVKARPPLWKFQFIFILFFKKFGFKASPPPQNFQ